MAWTTTANRYLIWLFVLGLGVQFFLAGLGVLGGESLDPHRGLGSALQLASVLIVILVAVGPFDSRTKAMSFFLVVLTVLQSLWASESLKPMWLRSFHVLDAFLIVGLAMNLARNVGFPLGKHRDTVSSH